MPENHHPVPTDRFMQLPSRFKVHRENMGQCWHAGTGLGRILEMFAHLCTGEVFQDDGLQGVQAGGDHFEGDI